MAVGCCHNDIILQMYIKFFQIWDYKNKNQGNRTEIAIISKHKGLFMLKKQVFRLIVIGNSA